MIDSEFEDFSRKYIKDRLSELVQQPYTKTSSNTPPEKIKALREEFARKSNLFKDFRGLEAFMRKLPIDFAEDLNKRCADLSTNGLSYQSLDTLLNG